ncbi:nitrogen regulation protein NR, partial [Vibrio lentus]
APAPRFEASTPVDAAASSTTKTPTQSKAQAETETTEREVPTQLALTMLTPVHDQTIRSNRGLIPIQIELNRKLGIGEQLQLILDGRRYGAPQTQPIWELKGID